MGCLEDDIWIYPYFFTHSLEGAHNLASDGGTGQGDMSKFRFLILLVRLRVPMLDYCVCRVNDGAVHVEEQAVEGDPLRRRRKVSRVCTSHFFRMSGVKRPGCGLWQMLLLGERYSLVRASRIENKYLWAEE